MALTLKEIIEIVIGSGLFSDRGEPCFSWDGCDYCRQGGSTVTDYDGYLSLDDAHVGPENLYDFKLCGDCLNQLYYYGE